MKIVFSILIIILAIQVISFGEDLVPQKVGIMIDKNSDNYNIDLILQKSILSSAEQLKDIYILPGDKQDLEAAGIKELNANLLLKSELKGSNYIINFYDVENRPVLLGDSIEFPKGELARSLDTLSGLIVSVLADKFPKKPKKELKKIETIKIKLSEFESLKPVYSILVIPNFVSINQMDVNVQYNSSNGSYGRDLKLNGYPFSATSEFQFRFQQWNAWLGLSGSFDNGTVLPSAVFSSYAGGGYGLFGSLLILGADMHFCHTDLKNNTNILVNYYNNGTNYTNQISMPDLSVNSLLIALTLQLNITKDYYILFKSGFPFIWNSSKFDFKDSAYSVPSSFYFNSSNGPPLIEILFNFRIYNKIKLLINYSYMSLSFSSDSGDSGSTKPVDVGNNFSMKRLSINQIRLGLGLEYEF